MSEIISANHFKKQRKKVKRTLRGIVYFISSLIFYREYFLVPNMTCFNVVSCSNDLQCYKQVFLVEIPIFKSFFRTYVCENA